MKANRDSTHPVGQKQPNAWKLYDMLGNVLEWTADWYDIDNELTARVSPYYSKGPSEDPQGPASGTERVIRGATAFTLPGEVRVTERISDDPGDRSPGLVGFRCVGAVLP